MAGLASAFTRLDLFGLGRHNPLLGVPPVEEPCSCEMLLELLTGLAAKINNLSVSTGGFAFIMKEQAALKNKLNLLIAAVERTEKGRL